MNCAECNNPFVDGDRIFKVDGLANYCWVCEECFKEYIRDLLITSPWKLAGIEIETDVYRPYE